MQFLPKEPVLIYATAEPDTVKTIQHKLGIDKASKLIEHTLSSVAKGLIQAGVRQLVVAGGETSGAVVQALEMERMVIGMQIAPGVPWTSATTPLCNGDTVHIALKSGNFGSHDFFEKSFVLLK